MKLVVPLCQKQIGAAGRLRQQLRQWQLSDAALVALHEKLPGFEPEACLLKSVAVNAIYGTNVLAIVRVAKHVKDVLSRHDLSQAGAELVIELANAPEGKGQRSRKRTSFASKFCHFFIDAKRFPIYDDAACQALKLHLGKRIKAHDYEAFCSCITQLKNLVGNGCDTRMLDHYLWLTGMYMRWLKGRKKENPKVNAELLELFNKPTKAQAAELDALLPAILDRAFKGEL
jgi:hypothetical protein